jgi:hypothetical protein
LGQKNNELADCQLTRGKLSVLLGHAIVANALLLFIAHQQSGIAMTITNKIKLTASPHENSIFFITFIIF